MMFNAGIQSHGPYLLVTGSGDAELPELRALADFPAAVLGPDHRVLVTYQAGDGSLGYTHCQDVRCSSTMVQTLDVG